MKEMFSLENPRISVTRGCLTAKAMQPKFFDMAGQSRFERATRSVAFFVLAGGLAQAPSIVCARKPVSAPPPRNEASWVEVQTPHFMVESNAGEAEARGVATDFEQIRALFHATFPELRVDPPQPIRIIVARDEATMRLITPDDWGGPEHVHPSGVFHSDGEKDYIVLRLDAEGTTAFHTSYHEYTHSLMHLNFSRLPLWVREGVAEFFGNSLLSEEKATTGTVDRGHVYVLSKNEWLPMETVFQVTEGSPFYNEKNPASVFYAESWATVHYLLLDPEARRRDLFKKYLVAWDSGANAVSAGRTAFGDLNTFRSAVQRYAGQANWRPGLALPGLAGLQSSSWKARTLDPAEALALRGDYFTHRRMLDDARPLLEEAAKEGPEISGVREALGYFYFRNSDFAQAQEETQRAIWLGAADFEPYFVLGSLELRNVAESEHDVRDARKNLERAAELNPVFAPTFEALAQAYSRSPETQGKALAAAETAVRLDANSRTYRMNLAYTLLNNGQVSQARAVAEKLEATAGSEEEKRSARSVLEAIADEEDWEEAGISQGTTTEFGPPGQGASGDSTSLNTSASSGNPQTGNAPVSHRQLGPPEWMAVDGSIAAVDCTRSPELTLTVNLPRGPMDFHAKDFGTVSVSGGSAMAVPAISACKSWTGRSVKIWFRMAKGQGFLGEIMRVYFY
jgi:tetratricopeptide (TPR) repeat protein